MYSFLQNHKNENLKFFILSKDFSIDNLKKIHILQKEMGFEQNAELIDISNLQEKFDLLFDDYNGKWSIDSFSKMCLCELVPKYVDKILYLDSDTIICENLDSLFDLNLNRYCVAGAADFLSKKYFKWLGISLKDFYFNSGILLWNLKECRKINLIKKTTDYLKNINGFVFFSEQTAINAVCSGKKLLIPLKFNAQSTIFSLTNKQIKLLRHPYNCVSISEIEDARRKPFILHMTTSFLVAKRPWFKNSLSPQNSFFSTYAKDIKSFEYYKDNRPKSKKVIDFIIKILPKTLIVFIVGLYYNSIRLIKYDFYKANRCKK
jgi:lipopolysaccharide biosynthesis glycosyltransferase